MHLQSNENANESIPEPSGAHSEIIFYFPLKIVGVIHYFSLSGYGFVLPGELSSINSMNSP